MNAQRSFCFVLLTLLCVSGRQLTQEYKEFSCEFQGQFLYMASLRDDFGNYRCGATLIAPSIVLTAATCMDPLMHDGVGVSEVYLGGQDREVPVERFPVTAFARHGNYTGDPREGNDIAVVKFAGETCMKPIPFLGKPSVEGETYLILGYGRTGVFEPLAGGLLAGNQTNFDIATCNADGVDPPLDEGRLCTQSPKCNCPSICEGDEGGPLVYSETIEAYTDTLMGVISYGTTVCGEGDGYGVYANVFAYRDWIDVASQTLA